MLLNVEEQVQEEILSKSKINKVTTPFIEYTESSIATK